MSATSTPFAVTTSVDGSSLSVRGDVTEQALPSLLAALETLEAHGGGTVNLTGVTFLPSRAIGEVVALGRRARDAGHALRLVAAEFTVAASVLRVTSVPHDHA
jgi:anti-anti-sigma regulatory factor